MAMLVMKPSVRSTISCGVIHNCQTYIRPRCFCGRTGTACVLERAQAVHLHFTSTDTVVFTDESTTTGLTVHATDSMISCPLRFAWW